MSDFTKASGPIFKPLYAGHVDNLRITKGRASYMAYSTLMRQREARADLAYRSMGEAYQRAARITDPATKAVWNRAGSIRFAIGHKLQKLGGKPKPLHADKGTTRESGRRLRLSLANAYINRMTRGFRGMQLILGEGFGGRIARKRYEQMQRLALKLSIADYGVRI